MRNFVNSVIKCKIILDALRIYSIPFRVWLSQIDKSLMTFYVHSFELVQLMCKNEFENIEMISLITDWPMEPTME